MPTRGSIRTNIFAAQAPSAGGQADVDYAAKNAQDIAKILQVNPAMGESMQRAYDARTENSQGLLSGLWNAVSGPAKAAFGALGNISSAFAEPFRNEPTGEEDNPIEDFLQGITGKENTYWRENLVSYGAPDDSWLTTVGGLAGDILLDPTNYLGAGGLGLGRDIVATGTKELAEHTTLQLLKKQAVEEGGMTILGRKVVDGEDIPAIIQELAGNELKKLNVADDMVDTLSGLAAGNVDRTILTSIDDAQQVVARWMGERAGSAILQGKSLRTLPPRMVDPLGGIWKRDELIEVFEKTSRLGPEKLNKLANEMFNPAGTSPVGFGTSSMIGRKAAAAVGGVRFKFGIPFTKRIADAHEWAWVGHRWQTTGIPLIPRFKIFGSGEGPVMNKMGNFFRGLSGMTRLDTAIQESIIKGDGLWRRDDMAVLMAKGFSGFEQEMVNQGRWNSYRALFGNKASTMFMSQSDRMGSLTAHVSPKAQMWRRLGYTGMRGAQELRNAGVTRKMFREFGAKYETEWAKASQRLDKLFKSGALNEQEVSTNWIRFLEGIDEDVTKLPDFLQPHAENMKEMFPQVLAEAKKYGASVGNIAEVYARRRSTTTLNLYRKEADKLTRQIENVHKEMAAERELLVGQLGPEAAVAQKSPKLIDLETELAQANEAITKVIESQKSLDIELSMMDEYDRMIKHLRPNYPAEKAMPSAYFHRRMTKEAREAITGSLQAEYKNWGRAKQVSAQMERVLADKSLEQAEAILRKTHGAALKHVKNVFEQNPFGVYAAYIEDMSEAVYKSQLKRSAEHVMGFLGAVDNGMAMRVNAYIPSEFAPRATKAQKALGLEPKFKNLSELLDRVQTAIGGKVARTSHVDGSAVWADMSKTSGKNMEPWRASNQADTAEYLDIDDIWDLREFDRAGKHQMGKVTDASPVVLRDVMSDLEKRIAARRAQVSRAGGNILDIDDDDYLDWVRQHKQLDEELARVKAGDSYSRANIDKLKVQLLDEGFKEPIWLDFSPINRGIKIAEGNHRMQAARELVEEGHEQFKYIPTRVITTSKYRMGSLGLPTTVLDEAHINGVNFDWEATGYIPANMRPSELFAVEAGRLGRIGSMTQDEADRLGLAVNEINLATAEMQGMAAIPEVAFTKITADIDSSRWGSLDVPGLENFVMHPFMAAEFNKAYQGMKNVGEFRGAWRKFVMGPWKKSATIYFPGFHARNFVGAWFNNTLGGVRLEHYGMQHKVSDVLRYGDESPYASQVIMRNVRIDGEMVKEMTYKDMAKLQMSRGIVGGNNLVVADLQTFLGKRSTAGVRGSRVISSRMSFGKIGAYQDELLGQVSYAEKAMREWESWGIRTTNTTESFFRGSAFMKGLEDAAGDSAGAREFVMMRHGDYAELTDFENGIRDLVPFYKWLRTNTPFQIRRLVEDPAKSLVVGDVQNALLPEDKRKQFASWVKNEFNIPMPDGLAKLLGAREGGGILVAQLPLHDLYVSTGEFASSFLPVVRNVVENTVLKKQVFTGAPIDDVHKTEAAGWMHTTGLAYAMEAVGLGEKGEDGKVKFSSRELNFMNIFPIFARSRAFLTEDPERKQLRYASFISAVGGVRPTDVLDAMDDGEREWYFEVLEPQIQELRALGYELPSISDMGVAGKARTDLLTTEDFGG